jgi:hypothetical protein
MADSYSIDDGRQTILAALERHQVLYVVIGGAAAQARGWPEPTDDIDVTPERSEGNLARLAAAVEELDAGFRVDPARYPRASGHPTASTPAPSAIRCRSDLIEELSTLTRNQLRIGTTNHTFPRLTKPNPIQAKTLQLLDIKLSK